MAPKRRILTDPPSISSSGQDEDGSSPEENTPQAQTPKSPPSKKPQSSTKTPPQQESSPEEETDSETEPEPVSQKRSAAAKPNPSPPSKKPQSSTKTPPQQESSPEEETDSETEPEPVSQKRSAVAKPNPASSPSLKLTKRATKSTDEVAKSSKRARTADDSSKKPRGAKKGRFERLWSEDDELALLNGMIEFEEERGMKVSKDLPGFFAFIEDSLHCKVKLPQVRDKMRKLKNKFVNNTLKGGVEPNLANSHDQDCFDLSMRIWGSDGASSSAGGLAESSGVKSSAAKKSSITDVGGDNKLYSSNIVLGIEAAKDSKQQNGKHGKQGNGQHGKQGNGQHGKQGNEQVEVERPLGVVENVQEAATDQADSLRRHFLRSCMGAANMEEMVKNGLEMFQGEKKTELEDRWTKFHVDRLELYLKHLDLLKEQSLLILEELKSSLVGKL